MTKPKKLATIGAYWNSNITEGQDRGFLLLLDDGLPNLAKLISEHVRRFEQEPISEREDFLSGDVYAQLREASRLMWSTSTNGVFKPALLSKHDRDTVMVYGLLNIAILEAQGRLVADEYNGMQYIYTGHGEKGSSVAPPSASASHQDDLHPQFDSLADPATREFVEHANPPLWRKCYPRIYSDPSCGPYYSPKSCAWMMAKIALIAEQVPVDADNGYDFFTVSHLARFGVPMFWLSDSIAQAIRQTVSPPGAIDWATLRMPFDAGVFMLPKGSLTHPESGDDVRFVAYARLQVGEKFVSPLDTELTYGFRESGGMVFMATVGPELEPRHWVLPLDEESVMSLMDLDDMFLKKSSDGGENLSDADRHLGAGVAHYILGTILLMNARPELVTSGMMQKRVMKKGDAPREFWTPNIIGEHYRIRRENVEHGGTHASPRFHWVRGFYRQQAHGAGFELRRQQWVEPYMRGIDAAIPPSH